MPLPAETRLGPYEVLGPLGSGGMGEVYRARDPRLGREIAIKVLAPALTGDAEALARFQREARAVAALSHPGILAIHDFGREGELSYAVTELLEGETLQAALVPGAFPKRRALEVAAAIAEALAAAHLKGIVHRDVKPGNVFLTSDGRVKLLDFGLARAAAPADPDTQTAAPTLAETIPGMILGTAPYMSPEQARGEAVDQRTDIFSLGSVLYEMLTGEKAFDGGTPAETLAGVLRDEPRLLDSADRIPPDVLPVLRHCLEKRREGRFQTAQDLVFALRGISSGAPPAIGRPGPAGSIESLAVLPFANSSGDPDLEYLSDGLSESLTNALSQIPEIKVIARNSTFRYKGKDADPADVARALGVRAIVIGRVLQRGDRLSVSVALVDALENRHLWGEQYARRADDIFAVQEDISREIVDKLRLRLGRAETAPAVRGSTADPAAYRLYLHGRHFWNKRPQLAEFQKALGYFQQAIERDPAFALAHVGIADYYASLGAWEFGVIPPGDAFPKARAAAHRALQIDEHLAEAHSTLGYILLYNGWEWAASEKAFQKALALNPGYTNAHHYYSHLLLSLGRTEESHAATMRALELDPLDVVLHAHLSWHYVFSRQYDLAIEQCERTLELAENFWSYFFRGLALEQKGELRGAIENLERSEKLSPGSTLAQSALGHAYGLAGDRKRAVAKREKLLRRPFTPAYDLALIHAGLGETEEGVRQIERAVQERSSAVAHMGLDPRLDVLRVDPRFEGILRRLGLPLAA